MRAIVLNGACGGDDFTEQAAVETTTHLAGMNWEVEHVVLRDREIAPCIGCFGCWVRTPGECVRDDEASRIAASVIQSDLVVYVTPVVFGGYSYELKKFMDRAISLLLPFFTRVDGEVHHVPRYEQIPRLLALGTLSAADPEMEKTFKWLVSRNAINLSSPAHLAEVIVSDQDHLNERIALVLAAVLEGEITA